MELTASTFIYVPILYPVAMAAGIDPIQFGIVVIMNMTLGLLTPPLVVNLFIAKGTGPLADFGGVCKAVLPMFAWLIGVLLLCTFVPAVSTVLL